jgi:hypothetical protein
MMMMMMMMMMMIMMMCMYRPSAILAHAAADGMNNSYHINHTSLINVQFTHEQEFMWGVHNTRLLTFTPPYAAIGVINPPITGTWLANAPRC